MQTLRYTYRIRPGVKAIAALEEEWHRSRFLWNECVSMLSTSQSLSFASLGKLLTEARRVHTWLRLGSQNAQQMTLRKFSQSYSQSFSIKGRGKPVYKSRRKSSPTLEYSTNGFSISKSGRLKLPKGTLIPVVWHRKLPSRPTSVCVHRDAVGHWWATFVVRKSFEKLPTTGKSIGIDWGVKTVATTTDSHFDLEAKNVRRKLSAKLARGQRKMARRYKKGVPQSKGYKAARLEVAKLHEKSRRHVKHEARVWSFNVSIAHDVIAVEDFKPGFLSKSRMSRKSADNAIAMVKSTLTQKATSMGRVVVLVPPAFTTMTCSRCGSIAKRPLGLAQRTFICDCGYVADRDKNAAQTILALAEMNQAGINDVRRASWELKPGGRIQALKSF